MKSSKRTFFFCATVFVWLSACGSVDNPPLPPLPPTNGGTTTPAGELSYIYYNGLYGFEAFRIPAIVMAESGSLLAFAEAREKRSNGDSGNIDLMVRRSEDGGKTWYKAVTIWDDGDNTCGNPVPIVDAETGRIHLLMTWNDGRDKWGTLVNATGHNTRRPFYTFSDDEGETWAAPRELTSQIKDSGWDWYGTGPCHGIRIANGDYKGRLISPNYYTVRTGSGYEQYSHVAYSDDGGTTWRAGGSTGKGVGECAVTELPDGSLLLSMRQTSGNGRYWAVSTDGGESWGEMRLETGFPDPQCQAGLTSSSSAVFISNASSTESENMTIRMSTDNGATWPRDHVVFDGLSAYSDMVMLSDDKIAIFFEGGKNRYTDGISFQVIEISKLN